MKKVVSLLLVLVLALGMSTVAFAADIYKQALPLDEHYTGTSLASYDVGPDAELLLPLNKDMFGLDKGPVTTSWLKTNKTTVRSAIKAGSKVIDSVSFDSSDVANDGSATDIATASLVEAIKANAGLGDIKVVAAAKTVYATPTQESQAVTIVKKILTDASKDNTLDAATLALFKDLGSNYKVAVKNSSTKVAPLGNENPATDWTYTVTPTGKTKSTNVKIKFVEYYVATGDVDYELTVYLMIDGKRQNDYEVTISGNMDNTHRDVYADDDYFDGSQGEVADCVEYAKSVEFDLGQGVSIYTKMFKDKKYYGIVTRDADDAADVVFTKYPDVDSVYILKTIGLNSTADTVKLNNEISGDYFVYDANMNYLGKSNESLKYSTRYYLANKKLEVASDAAETEEEEVPEDTVPTPNVNDNPGTGR
jgi:hypothetical protein